MYGPNDPKKKNMSLAREKQQNDIQDSKNPSTCHGQWWVLIYLIEVGAEGEFLNKINKAVLDPE